MKPTVLLLLLTILLDPVQKRKKGEGPELIVQFGG